MKKTLTKSLALLLAVLMLMTAMPMGVFAAGSCAHKWSSLTFFDAVKADATKHGQIEYCYCSDCQKYFKMGTNGPDFTKELDQGEWLIHFFPEDKDYDLTVAANIKELKDEATCKSGNVYYKKCKHCDVYSDTLTIEDNERAAHTPADEWTVPSGADCTKADFTKRLLCTVCGEDAEPAVTIKKGEHDEVNMDIVEANCLKEGHKAGVYCTKCCKYLMGGESIPKTSHDIQVIIKGTEATCTEAGTQDVKRCIICKSKETLVGGTMKNDSIVPNVIPKLGHSLADVTKKDKTCEEDGYRMDARICSRCGLSFSPMGADVVDKATGHNPVFKDEQAATTSHKGWVKHYECENEIVVNGKTQKCGQLFLQEVDDKGIPKVDPTTHKPILRKATEAEVMKPIKDHTHKEVKNTTLSKDKTCLEDGRLVIECDICHQVIKDEVLKATGHDWKWVESAAATCTAAGSRYEKCSVCGATRGEPQPTDKAEHTWELTTPADCTKGGKAIYTCKVCGATKEETVAKQDKHTDADDNGVCDVCETKFCSCICHNQAWYGKILLFFVQVWWQFLGIRQTCACGKVHYVKAATQDVPSVT